MAAKPRAKIPPRIRERDLTVHGAGTPGGSSIVFPVFGFGDKVLYKKYASSRPESGYDTLIEIPSGLDSAEADFVDEHFAWPLSVVTSNKDEVVGVLLPKAEPAYWAHLSTDKVRVRDFNYLLYEARSARVGVEPPTLHQKLDLIRSFAEVLAWLEGRGLVHEDLAAQNVLWRISPNPSVLLLDCDSIRPVLGKTSDPLYVTTDWSDPRVLTGRTQRPDTASMSYAVGLLTARVFVEPTWRPSLTDAPQRLDSELPADVSALLVDAVAASIPRPALGTWMRVLLEARQAASETVANAPAVAEVASRPELRRGGLSYAAKERFALAAGFLIGAAAAAIILMEML